MFKKMELTMQSECMEGNESIPCHTLSYILNHINNRSNDTFNGINISAHVYITYYQEITNLSHLQLLVNLYLIGVHNPIFFISVELFMTLLFMVLFTSKILRFTRLGHHFTPL